MAGFRSRVADVLSAIKGSTIEPQSVNTEDLDSTRISQDSGWDESQTPHWMPVIEDFERGTLSYYDALSSVQIASSTVLQGSNSLQVDANSATFELFSPFKIERGWSYRFYYYVDGASTTEARFYPGFGQDRSIRTFDQTGYDFPIRWDNDDLRIREHDGGTSTTLSTASAISAPTDEWVFLQVDFGFEDIVATLTSIDGTQVATTSATDTNHTGGYWIQWGQNQGDGDNFIGYVTRRPL